MDKIIKCLIGLLFVCAIISCSGLLEKDEDRNDVTDAQDSQLSVTSRSGLVSDEIVEYLGHKYFVTSGPLRVEDARVVFNDSLLTATHHALCIKPENMEQLHELEKDSLLIIFYHPFEYVLVPDSYESEQSGDRAASLASDELEESCISEDEQDFRPIMCPVYVLWPVSQPLPAEMDYEELFEAYHCNTDSLRGNPGQPEPEPHISGYLRGYDNRLGQYLPIWKVKLEYTDIFSMTRVAYTDFNGYFNLPYADSSYPLVVDLQNSKFAVRDGVTSNVKSLSLTFSDYIISFPSNDYNINLLANYFLDIYKAAQYYFYTGNPLLNLVTKYNSSSGALDIHAINSSRDVPFKFYNAQYTPTISIWNNYSANYSGASSKVFGNVLNSLGEATHRMSVGYSQLNGTDLVIRESFAYFFGWYNTYQYYGSYIGSDQSLVNSICNQGRQEWTSSSVLYNATPIYIDLFDDYNQHTALSSLYNDDPISDVSLSFILSSAIGPTAFQDVCDTLATGVGTHYTSSEYATFIAPYSCFLPEL